MDVGGGARGVPGAAAEDEAGLLLPAGPGVLHMRRGPVENVKNLRKKDSDV